MTPADNNQVNVIARHIHARAAGATVATPSCTPRDYVLHNHSNTQCHARRHTMYTFVAAGLDSVIDKTQQVRHTYALV